MAMPVRTICYDHCRHRHSSTFGRMSATVITARYVKRYTKNNLIHVQSLASRLLDYYYYNNNLGQLSYPVTFLYFANIELSSLFKS